MPWTWLSSARDSQVHNNRSSCTARPVAVFWQLLASPVSGACSVRLATVRDLSMEGHAGFGLSLVPAFPGRWLLSWCGGGRRDLGCSKGFRLQLFLFVSDCVRSFG